MGLLDFLRRKKKYENVEFEGGSGDTTKSAIIIRGASNHVAGVLAEYQYLGEKFGRRDVDWWLVGQTLVSHGGRKYDQMEIKLSDSTQRVVLFDITEFFGKQP